MPELAVTVWVAVAGGVICVMSVAMVAIWIRSVEKRNGGAVSDPWLLRAPLLPLVFAVVSGLIAVYALILHFAFGSADFKLPAKANITSPILVAATLIAGSLTAAYAVLKLRAHLIAEARGKLDVHVESRADEKHKNDQEAAYSERFARAVTLLADSQPISRIAGAHLVLAIGDEWMGAGAQQRCFDVLLSHLRGLNQDKFLEDESAARGRREEVRLVTSEVLRRLTDGASAWAVAAGDFSGAVIADFDLTKVRRLPRLDLRGARVLGDLTIPATASSTAPQLSGVVCEGDVSIELDAEWGPIDLSDAEAEGSVSLTAQGDGKTLREDLDASRLVAGGSLGLSFDLFEADVFLDSATVEGDIVVGSAEFGAAFDKQTAPTLLSATSSSFGELRLRRADPGPRLDLTGASGAVDLSDSKFAVEVTANGLDASTGLRIKGASFGSGLVLDGATTPDRIDLEGVVLSERAKSAIRSSDFALRDQLLILSETPKPDRPFSHNAKFEWAATIEPFREQYGDDLINELARRLSRLDAELPVDWDTRETFTAQVMSAVIRSAAVTGAPEEAETALKQALRDAIERARSEEALL